MRSARLKRLSITATLIAIALSASVRLWARSLDDSISAGTLISIRAEAIYSDAAGEKYSTVSETITVTISAIATLVVTPDETVASDTVAPNDQMTRVFRVCNTGNNVDTFTLTRADLTSPATLEALYFDTDSSGTLNDGDALARLNE